MNNKQLGNAFEREFCEVASNHGYWVHKFQDNKNGQPCDIIISKNKSSTIIDCKVCVNNTFVLSRMEENQILAMNKWLMTGNSAPYFALKLFDIEDNGVIRMIPFGTLLKLKEKGFKRIDMLEILEISVDVGELLRSDINADNNQ